jgi:nucleoside-diphosphate-sugar epimerase
MSRVFVTGATGYVGGAIAARLKRAGHDVFGLTRNVEHQAGLQAAGVTPVIGDVADSDAYLAVLKNCDAAVHAAFDGASPAPQDQRVLEAVRSAAQDGRVRRFLFTSGVWVLGPTGETAADESTPLRPAEAVTWRPAHEEVALDLASYDVEAVVFRPGMVYGGSGGTAGKWFQEARTRRTVSFPGDGRQHWTMVHRDDVAEAYALALEHARGGERYYLTDESRFTVRELAEAVARVSDARARPTDPEELVQRLGGVGRALLMDQIVTSAKARRELGWVPRHTHFPGEIEALHREWLTGQRAPVA